MANAFILEVGEFYAVSLCAGIWTWDINCLLRGGHVFIKIHLSITYHWHMHLFLLFYLICHSQISIANKQNTTTMKRCLI